MCSKKIERGRSIFSGAKIEVIHTSADERKNVSFSLLVRAWRGVKLTQLLLSSVQWSIRETKCKGFDMKLEAKKEKKKKRPNAFCYIIKTWLQSEQGHPSTLCAAVDRSPAIAGETSLSLPDGDNDTIRLTDISLYLMYSVFYWYALWQAGDIFLLAHIWRNTIWSLNMPKTHKIKINIFF